METVFPEGAILEMAFELAGIIVLELQEKRQGIAIGEILVGRGQDPAPGAGLESLDQVFVEKVQSRALEKRRRRRIRGNGKGIPSDGRGR